MVRALKILILGHAGAGKDTVAKIIARKTAEWSRKTGYPDEPLRLVSATQVAAKLIYPRLVEEVGYESLYEAVKDKANQRKLWFDLIRELTWEDEACLVKEVLKCSDIYVGLRSWVEYEAVKEQKLFDLVLWVKNNRVGDESRDSFDIDFNMREMTIIDNDADFL